MTIKSISIDKTRQVQAGLSPSQTVTKGVLLQGAFPGPLYSSLLHI